MTDSNPCPTWCTVRHGQPADADTHFAVTAFVPVGTREMGKYEAVPYAAVGTYQGTQWDAEAGVSVQAWEPLPGKLAVANIGKLAAESLARLVALLADATPEQHHSVADGIRQAAALIGDEASADD